MVNDGSKDLLEHLSKDEVFQLAEDRSMVSKSLSGSITQTLKKDVQLTGGITVYEAEGTVASGAVAAVEGTGYDQFYYTQLTTYNLNNHNTPRGCKGIVRARVAMSLMAARVLFCLKRLRA